MVDDSPGALCWAPRRLLSARHGARLVIRDPRGLFGGVGLREVSCRGGISTPSIRWDIGFF